MVRRWLEDHSPVKRFMNPAGYGLNIVSPASRPFALGAGRVLVPGHYDAPGGGCDMIKSVDHIYDVVAMALQHYDFVLMEGLFVGKDARRLLDRGWGPDTLVIFLDLPLEICRASVHQRRESLGKPRKELTKHEDDWGEINAKIGLLKAAGVAVEHHDRDSAAARLRELLP